MYIRYGRSECPDVENTEEVYTGRVGHSWYSHGGSGTGYLCMPDDPEYDTYRAGFQSYSPLYGVEYESPVSETNLHDYNVPCAVCFAKKRAALLMLPAKLECPKKWTKEYGGYLMTSHKSHSAATYECVDRDLEGIDQSEANLNGGLFYNVEVECDRGLECGTGEYNQEKEVTCVVCTR